MIIINKLSQPTANIAITLMDLDKLTEAVVEHYELMDSEVRTLLPLAKVYWPA
jgi:restriction system protein